MLRQVQKQMSLHSILYNKISENHILKKINYVVDFSFINKLLEDSYCKNFGRPAKEPEMMCKLLFLQHLYILSDEKVIEEANLNLGYMYFLGINPEDELPDKSLLSKFRTQRLEEATLDEIITEIVRQCVEKGIIGGTSVSVDATHIEANTIRKTPERLMKHLARKIIKTYEKENNQVLEEIPEVPKYKEIEDHTEAKAVMKDYLENVISKVKKNIRKDCSESIKTKETIEKAREIIEDPKFLNQKGVRSIIDEDARVGRKSKNQEFYGYKTEFMMTADERIITSVRTADGAYVDGTYADELIEQTLKSGMKIEEVYGDKAYFRKPILNSIEEIKAKAYMPVSFRSSCFSFLPYSNPRINTVKIGASATRATRPNPSIIGLRPSIVDATPSAIANIKVAVIGPVVTLPESKAIAIKDCLEYFVKINTAK